MKKFCIRSANTMRRKVIFLDRDGTINADHGYVHTPESFEWLPGAQEALARFQDAGYALAVITNQSGIAHGLYTEQDMHNVHDFMKSELKKAGIVLDAIAYCPHGRNQTVCGCRKPDIGMARQVEAAIGEIDYANSWIIGDKEADVGFGKKAGTKTALIRSRYWSESALQERPDVVVDSLKDAAKQILDR